MTKKKILILYQKAGISFKHKHPSNIYPPKYLLVPMLLYVIVSTKGVSYIVVQQRNRYIYKKEVFIKSTLHPKSEIYVHPSYILLKNFT